MILDVEKPQSVDRLRLLFSYISYYILLNLLNIESIYEVREKSNEPDNTARDLATLCRL